jgi:hypothetical protein
MGSAKSTDTPRTLNAADFMFPPRCRRQARPSTVAESAPGDDLAASPAGLRASDAVMEVRGLVERNDQEWDLLDMSMAG